MQRIDGVVATGDERDGRPAMSKACDAITGAPSAIGIMKGGAFVGDPSAPVKRHTAREIADALRLIGALLGEGQRISDAVRVINVTEVTYYRWRRKYEGLSDDQIEYLVQLQAENASLRREIAELNLDKRILQEVAKDNLVTSAQRRSFVDHVKAALGISERRACQVLGQHRSTQRKIPKLPMRLHRGSASSDLPSGL
jgi:transposase-like protein